MAIRVTARGGLITCEHGGRRVTRTEHDGSITVLLDRFDGRRLNSPNDVVVKSDGSIWFTDPPFGILGYYQGVEGRAGTAGAHLPHRWCHRRRRRWWRPM
jgi:sugar lactone lactonase YvrE